MLKVRWFCHYGALTGYGRAARDYLAALERVPGIELEIAVLGDGLSSPEPRYAHLDQYAVPFQQVRGWPDVEIYHAQPRILAAVDQLAAPDQLAQRRAEGTGYKRVALTTWETSPMPPAVSLAMGNFDAVIVPSEFCADLMNDAIYGGSQAWFPEIVPHCFDEDWWKMPIHTVRSDSSFRFYSIGAWGERKNMIGLLKAYIHAFTKADPVQLMLLIEEADFDEIRSTIARSGLQPQALPELFVPSQILTEEQLLDLHSSADCFVTATRGEGWGLGLFEAAIMGRHVIAPLWGGQSDFLDNYEWTHAVPYQMTPCFGGENRMRVEEHGGQMVQISKVALPPGVDCRQVWADPDLEALAETMRSVYENREQRSEHDTHEERASLEAQFGYKTVGPMLANKLREIANL